MSEELFGVPKYGNSGSSQRNHKIEPGHNFFRFGPPYKSLAASGKWNQYSATHFGYLGLNRQDPSKTVARPFVCPQEKNRRTGITTVPCKECDKIAATKGILDTRKAQLKAEGRTDAEISQLTDALQGWCDAHNVSKKYLTIAKNEKGEWGVLQLPIKVKQGLEAKIAQLVAEDGLSALAIENGVWFDIVRSGEKWATTYDVQVVMETVPGPNGRPAKVVKVDTLTKKDFDDIVANCPDLTTVGTRLSQEQIALLANSNGDPEEVDSIFAQATVERSKSRTPVARPVVVPTPAPVATPAPAIATPAPAVVQAPVAAPAVDQAAMIAALQAQLATMMANMAAAAPAPVVTPAPVVVPTPAPAPVTVTAPPINAKDLNDADFVAMFGKA
jgi:uncharacterized protein YajQ (UPF0234 family)